MGKDTWVPELPEVEALARFLSERATGKRVEAVHALAFAALKTYEPPLDALVGLTLAGASRRGKFLCLEFPPLHLVIHLALAGWVRWSDSVSTKPARPNKGPGALRLRFDDGSGFDVTEMGTEKRVAVYVVRRPDEVEGVARLGVDVLDPAFDVAALKALLSDRSGQIKKVLTDQSVIAGVGNAYSDEALHAARLSPFKPASGLSDEEVTRLHRSLIEIVTDAVARSVDLPASGLKKEKKSGLRVHGRTGEPCPVCGDTVREVAFATRSLQYCPTCQTGGKPLADRRFSKFLK